MSKVADHVQKKHAVHTMSDTIVNLVSQKVRKT
jgi:predicted small metal-binding protein